MDCNDRGEFRAKARKQTENRRRSSRLGGGTAAAEAGKRIGFVVEGADQVEQAQDVEGHQRGTARPYDAQVATLVASGDAYLDDDAEAGTIHVGEFGEIEHKLASAIGDELIQTGSEQVALTVADGRPAAQV